MFLSKRARMVYKLECKPYSSSSLINSRHGTKEGDVLWTVAYCCPDSISEPRVSLNNLCLVISSAVCLLLYRFPKDILPEIESEESQTVDEFSTNETPIVYDDESFDRNKYIPLGIGFEKHLFLSNRINLGNIEKGIWITALCSCVAANEDFIGLLVQSRWILVGWNNGNICLVDIQSGKALAEFSSEKVQSAVCCLTHQCKSSLFASGHMNGDIWLWSWQPHDCSLVSINNSYPKEFSPFLQGDVDDVKELKGCHFKKIPLARIDTGMGCRSWIRFANTSDNCILLCNTKNKLQFITIREPLHPFVNTEEESFHISTTTISIDNCYGQILDGILTNTCIISCGQDDTIRIFQRTDSFSTNSSLSCELYQHFSYVTCLELSPNQKVLISASLDGTILFWLLEDCLPSRYVHPLSRIHLENVTIKRMQLVVPHHLLVSGNALQNNTCVLYCLTLPAIIEKEISCKMIHV